MLRSCGVEPSRLISKMLYSGRERARGPERVESFLPDGHLHRMFENIGKTYDVQNHILSFGRDIHWRHILGDLVRPTPGQLVCDMATGTGDVAIELARRNRDIRVIGVDFSAGMLAVAAKKIARWPDLSIDLLHGDIQHTTIPSSSADVITISFALRNIPDRNAVLGEFQRVLRPGGRLYIMDFAMPTHPIVKFLYGQYFDHVMPLVGNLLSRTDYAYSYLRESVRAFPSPADFADEIKDAGFHHVEVRYLSYGLAVVYCARNGDKTE